MTSQAHSTVESKKLLTFLCPDGSVGAPSGRVRAAFDHDARIAHEQRRVIRMLVDALVAEMQGGACTNAYSAIACARPFLEG